MAEQRTRRPHGPMGGPGRGMMPGEKPKDFKNYIEKLVRYLGRYWYAIVAVMIFAAVSTVFSVAGPKVMARATNAPTGVWTGHDQLPEIRTETYINRNHFLRI